jgi:hypothetical protein
MLSVVDAKRTIHVDVHNALADVAMAALAAEPVTIDELHSAMTRFVKAGVVAEAMQPICDGIATRRSDGGHVIIDMTAKLLIADTPCPSFPRIGNVQSCDTITTLDLWLPYRIPDDWLMLSEASDWEETAVRRRSELAGSWHRDHRQVLYGRLPRWLVEQWQQRAERLEEPIPQLQESWLLTPRNDLCGKTPRDILLAKHKYIDSDVQDQGESWGITGNSPPGLAPSSHAYRFGGFGSHEVILYHEMTTYLLLECERRLGSASDVDLEKEVRHLEQLQQEWLHQPHETLYDQSPAAIIARERARLPSVVPKGHSDEHDDCPLCRMMFESGQPMIWQLDSFALNRSFATSLFETYDEWQAEHEMWDAMCEEIDESASDALPGDRSRSDEARVWRFSHTNMDSLAEMPPLEACAVMVFSIGGHMGELIEDLKNGHVELCRELHQQFEDLRMVFKEQQEVWMLKSAIGSFALVLQDVAQQRSDLAAKCADLEDKLDYFGQRYEEHFDPYSASDQI